MTSGQLVFLRLYMMTLGRMALFAELLRKVLVFLLIYSKKADSYHASSKFFSMKELVPDSGEEKVLNG